MLAAFFSSSSCREIRTWHWYDTEHATVLSLEHSRWMHHPLGFRHHAINKAFGNNLKALFSLSS